MPEQTKSTLQSLLDWSTSTAVPIAQSLVFGGRQATPQELAAEQNYFDSLNGSGAPDRQGFLNASSRDLNTFLYGNAARTNPANGPQPAAALFGGFSAKQIAIAIVGSIVAALLIKKFL